MNGRLDVQLPGKLVRDAAGNAGLHSAMSRAGVIRYFVALKAGRSHAQALASALGDSNRKNSMAPSDNRIGALIPDELVSEALSECPDGTTPSIMVRAALYEHGLGYPADEALEMATRMSRRGELRRVLESAV
jgi:hypothetical protein